MSSVKIANIEESVEKGQERVEEPPMFEVLLHNDDYTTMDFVIAVLQDVFQKNEVQATEIMLNVHEKGLGVAGVYTRDIAETKAAMAQDWARQEGHPLRCTVNRM